MEVFNRILKITNFVKDSFDYITNNEDKLENTELNRELVKSRNSQNIVPYNNSLCTNTDIIRDGLSNKNLMRKLMNGVIEEILINYDNSVYIGEDVTHGGYYLVTEGLHKKYPLKVRDIPPDETSLIGIGMGYSHAGLLPIIEIPYAKYLDCGFDMYNECIIMNWLSNGNQSNGLILRLQGFGNGLFGGNFHTHNTLYIQPGIDVVCYSNGDDYVRGWRYAIQQAKAGRVVMSVDCTMLLNKRHIIDADKDGCGMKKYPETNQYIAFDDIMLYSNNSDNINDKIIITDMSPNDDPMMDDGLYMDVHDITNERVWGRNADMDSPKIVIITYGVGMHLAQESRKELRQNYGYNNIIIIDTPYLSDIPTQLTSLLHKIDIDGIIFADMCKEGQNPLNGYIIKLQKMNILQKYTWNIVSAQYTYNPLGKDLTFLSKNDIIHCIRNLNC